ncbi:MAG: FHA domain-containing protein [Proteobacteria bacterium]|nr:FHA domain-containing protein [Pseudomonadota bacterium]
MINLVVRAHGKPDRAMAFDTTDLAIGRVQGNDLVLLASGVAMRHARIIVKDASYVLIDLRSTAGTLLNGERLTASRVLAQGDRIQIGSFEVELGPFAEFRASPQGAIEARFHEVVSRPDADEDRLVYADWLEGIGQDDRAAYLRGVVDGSARERVAVIARGIPRSWRALVTAPPIEQCPRGACPGRWDRLPRGENDLVRACDICAMGIAFAATAFEARGLRHERGVVVDPAAPRVDDDLAGQSLQRPSGVEIKP